MTFKEAILKHNGLKIMAERLPVASALGRQRLYQTEFSTDKMWIEKELSLTTIVQKYLCAEINRKNLKKLRNLLSETHNINGSLQLLEKKLVLDDISFFEIKFFALKCGKIRSILFDLPADELILPDLNEIVQLLDPEGLETQQFYIYAAYEPKLAKLRKSYNEMQNEDIFIKIREIEDKIRVELSENLIKYIEILYSAMDIVAAIDVNFAKAELYSQWAMQRPQVVEDALIFNDLTYPPAKEKLMADGKTFQPITVSINYKPVLLTGANMAGKTMLLSSLAFAQFCLQFGFFVAAKSAKMSLVEDILTSIGDFQNENDGLSSFAAEILHINTIIQHFKNKKRYLVLIDELARTTNPYEGAALVRGFVNIMAAYKTFSVVTTHYSVDDVKARRLRVRGFVNHNLTPPVNIKDIVKNMDYSLIEDNSVAAPQEALNLAKLLAIDTDWIKNAMN
ncbi:MAG: hypothetical protein LBR17_03645 [Bacteroidales bacterium]|jgi:dsDNA-specific endonuclease/ATPase MutS2|nr:hypothetical protein [Bacteroidales bacterium]